MALGMQQMGFSSGHCQDLRLLVLSATQMAAMRPCVRVLTCACTLAGENVLKRQRQSVAGTRKCGGGPRPIFAMFLKKISSVSGTRVPSSLILALLESLYTIVIIDSNNLLTPGSASGLLPKA